MAHTNLGLVKLLLCVLKDRLNGELPVEFNKLESDTSAIVDANVKRALITLLVKRWGVQSLFQAGRYLGQVESTPILRSLIQTKRVEVVIDKWMRLEAYQHSSHRTKLTMANQTTLMCERGPDASREENLLIASVLTGILELIGCKGCVLSTKELSIPFHRGKTDLQPLDIPEKEPFQFFCIQWEHHCFDKKCDGNSSLLDQTLSEKVYQLLAADSSRHWSVDEMCSLFHMSRRTFQRKLAEDNRSFNNLMARVRVQEACELLLNTKYTTAEIGYLCGYTDQPHFQREFRKATNMTPMKYAKLNH